MIWVFLPHWITHHTRVIPGRGMTLYWLTFGNWGKPRSCLLIAVPAAGAKVLPWSTIWMTHLCAYNNIQQSTQYAFSSSPLFLPCSSPLVKSLLSHLETIVIPHSDQITIYELFYFLNIFLINPFSISTTRAQSLSICPLNNFSNLLTCLLV
jgi:hypothetical protein